MRPASARTSSRESHVVLGRANVKQLEATHPPRQRQPHDGVADVGEVAGLLPITSDGIGVKPSSGLRDEGRNGV
jgi:hypothetical protein